MRESLEHKLHAVVSGRVQGMFFRMFVLREAQALGLAGSVRNRRDGAVEVEAWGEWPKLEQLVERLKQGPPDAAVAKVEAEWTREPALRQGFEIDYG